MDASKEDCLVINTEKNKYILLSHHQSAGKKKIQHKYGKQII
jgi:hypothetical protein